MTIMVTNADKKKAHMAVAMRANVLDVYISGIGGRKGVFVDACRSKKPCVTECYQECKWRYCELIRWID